MVTELSDDAATGALDAAQVWADHAADLLGLATVLVGPHDAHDVVSLAFQRVIDRTDGGFRPTDLRSYLVRSVTNTANDQHRSRKRRQRRDLHGVVEQSIGSSDESAPVRVDIRRAVADLSVQQRAVVYLTYWEDLDSTAVGAVLDIAPATVRRHLVRARFQLRKELS